MCSTIFLTFLWSNVHSMCNVHPFLLVVHCASHSTCMCFMILLTVLRSSVHQIGNVLIYVQCASQLISMSSGMFLTSCGVMCIECALCIFFLWSSNVLHNWPLCDELFTSFSWSSVHQCALCYLFFVSSNVLHKRTLCAL